MAPRHLVARSARETAGRRVHVKRVPPQDLVAQVERQRAAWGDALPGRARRGRAIRVVVQGTDTIVTVGYGRDQGIDVHWHAAIVDAQGRSPPGGACTIVRVDRTPTMCRTTLTPDQVRANLYVELRPVRP